MEHATCSALKPAHFTCEESRLTYTILIKIWRQTHSYAYACIFTLNFFVIYFVVYTKSLPWRQ